MGPLIDASNTSQRIREGINVTLKRLRHSHLNNVIFSYLNFDSMRNRFFFFLFFFSIWIFFHEHSRITELQGKGEGFSLTPHYHFYSLHRHLDISWAITAENSPLHIASSRTRTGNLWFPSASR